MTKSEGLGPVRIVVLFIVSAFVRLMFAVATRSLTEPHNHYHFILKPDGSVGFPAAGFVPPGGYYATKLLYALSGYNLAAFGVLHVLLGALMPPLLVILAVRLYPTIPRNSAWAAGWIAAVFPPLVFLSGTWRYMLIPTLLGLFHLYAILKRSTWMAVVAGALLLITRPDFYVGGLLVGLCTQLGERSLLRKLTIFIAPLLVLSLHSTLTSDAGRISNFWYNVDAGANPRSRTALINYGPELSYAEATLNEPIRDEPLHRANFITFAREQPSALIEVLVLKLARVFDVHRDTAMSERPLENACYSLALTWVLVGSLIGMGMLGIAASTPSLLLLLGYAIPMILVFSVDRTRILLQAIWLIPCGHCLCMAAEAVRQKLAQMQVVPAARKYARLAKELSFLSRG